MNDALFISCIYRFKIMNMELFRVLTYNVSYNVLEGFITDIE